ncbi:unnamed protein product, partial [Phaeothamnion confervicola]
TTCRRQPLLEYFGEYHSEACGNCDNCLEPPATWNATQDAQKLLSCVYRTGQRFGAAHVIDVLRGVDNDKVRQYQHAELSTFGIGSAHSVLHWRSVLRQLMVRGVLVADVERFGALRLEADARALLRGETSLFLREDIAVARTPRRKASTTAADVPMSADDEALWDQLRACRKRLADDDGVPPYVVFHDRTLREMATRRPSTLSALLTITGVGQAKLERYGSEFLAVLTAL